MIYYISIAGPPALFLCIMAWRTYRQESAHRRINEQQLLIDAQQQQIKELRAELEEFKKAHPFMRIMKTGN